MWGCTGFRHYFASNALGSGIPVTDVGEWMGHKSIEETYRTYRHLMPGSITKAPRTWTGMSAFGRHESPGVPGGLPEQPSGRRESQVGSWSVSGAESSRLADLVSAAAGIGVGRTGRSSAVAVQVSKRSAWAPVTPRTRSRLID